MKTHSPISLQKLQYTPKCPTGKTGAERFPGSIWQFEAKRKAIHSKRVPLSDEPKGEWRVQSRE